MKTIAIFLVRLYQLCISPFTGSNCRFHPTCSAYAIESFEKHGFFKGFYLTLKRLGKCQPWHPGGEDRVPDKKPPLKK